MSSSSSVASESTDTGNSGRHDNINYRLRFQESDVVNNFSKSDSSTSSDSFQPCHDYAHQPVSLLPSNSNNTKNNIDEYDGVGSADILIDSQPEKFGYMLHTNSAKSNINHVPSQINLPLANDSLKSACIKGSTDYAVNTSVDDNRRRSERKRIPIDRLSPEKFQHDSNTDLHISSDMFQIMETDDLTYESNSVCSNDSFHQFQHDWHQSQLLAASSSQFVNKQHRPGVQQYSKMPRYFPPNDESSMEVGCGGHSSEYRAEMLHKHKDNFCEKSLFYSPIDHIDNQFDSRCIPKDRRFQANLLNLCRSNGCPSNFFDKLLKFLKEELKTSDDLIMLQNLKQKKSFVDWLTTTYEGCTPTERFVSLEHPHVMRTKKMKMYPYRRLRETVPMIVFNFQELFEDLLSMHEAFCDPDNLIVNSVDAFSPYINTTNLVDDILDGQWYSSTVKWLSLSDSKQGHKKFLLPIIFYVDKTGTDKMNRYPVEPLLFTLGIFRRHLRTKPQFWRCLALLPDLEAKSSAVCKQQSSTLRNKGISCRNYHKCLSVALESFVKFQNSDIQTFLRVGDYISDITAVTPLCCVINDGKSADVLTGRYVGYNTQCMTRCCECSLDECDNHDHKCILLSSPLLDFYSSVASLPEDFLTNEMYKRLSRSEKKEYRLLKQERKDMKKYCASELHSLSQHRHISAFRDVCFGGNNHGIAQAVPIDLMHAFLEGVMQYVVKVFIKPMNADMKSQLDHFIDDIFSKVRVSNRQEHEFLKTTFIKGFTNLTLITADEWVSMAFTLLCVACTQYGKLIFEHANRTVTGDDHSQVRFEEKTHMDPSSISNPDPQYQPEVTKYRDQLEELIQSEGLLPKPNWQSKASILLEKISNHKKK